MIELPHYHTSEIDLTSIEYRYFYFLCDYCEYTKEEIINAWLEEPELFTYNSIIHDYTTIR